jgi:quercetin dioxygenase-like cupin family protein
MTNRLLQHGIRLATQLAVIAGLTLTVAPAFAGSCPADKVVAAGKGQPKSDAAAIGVTDTVVVSTDLAKEPAAIKGRLFRLRKLVIQPGGIVPWHSHMDRPALITIITGEIVEYASTCAVPIVHKAGESTAETHATAHWWKNLGTETVVLYSADLFPTTAHDAHMM